VKFFKEIKKRKISRKPYPTAALGLIFCRCSAPKKKSRRPLLPILFTRASSSSFSLRPLLLLRSSSRALRGFPCRRSVFLCRLSPSTWSISLRAALPQLTSLSTRRPSSFPFPELPSPHTALSARSPSPWPRLPLSSPWSALIFWPSSHLPRRRPLLCSRGRLPPMAPDQSSCAHSSLLARPFCLSRALLTPRAWQPLSSARHALCSSQPASARSYLLAVVYRSDGGRRQPGAPPRAPVAACSIRPASRGQATLSPSPGRLLPCCHVPGSSSVAARASSLALLALQLGRPCCSLRARPQVPMRVLHYSHGEFLAATVVRCLARAVRTLPSHPARPRLCPCCCARARLCSQLARPEFSFC
jgi:hypothetical protein